MVQLGSHRKDDPDLVKQSSQKIGQHQITRLIDMNFFTTGTSENLFQLMYVQALALKALPSLVNCKILVIYDTLAVVCETL